MKNFLKKLSKIISNILFWILMGVIILLVFYIVTIKIYAKQNNYCFYFDYCLSMQRNFFAEMCKGTLYKMAISYYGSPKKCMIVATCFGERRRLRAR